MAFVLTLARHLAFALLAWGVSLTPLDSHVQVSELGAYGFPVAAQSGAAVAWTPVDLPELHPSRPLCASRVSFSKLVSAFILFILVHFLVFPLFTYVYLLYSRNCASVI